MSTIHPYFALVLRKSRTMKTIITFCLLFTSISVYGNGINVSNISFDGASNELSFTLTWENSWFFLAPEPDLYDAAWVFIKYSANGSNSWTHAEILDSVPVQSYVQYISYDDLGLMVYESTEGNRPFGPATFTVELAPLQGSFQDFKVFATEMVFIDDGEFYAGDVTSPGRFYEDGNTSSPWLVDSEDPIMRGNGSGEFQQEGSSSTQDISASFPKGYNSFFTMKYKITASQYTDFLNCLTRTQQNARTQANLSGAVASNKYVMTNTSTVEDRNPIACDINIGTGPIEFFLDLDPSNEPNSSNDGGNLVLNHLSASDILAYLDWSGMRPMTELEYEKICRGNALPVGGEYCWGTDTWNPAGGITNSGTIGESTVNVGLLTSLFKADPLRSGYAATSTSGRLQSGASFFGVMDIHNLGEFMYGVESGNFSKGSYGDGNLDAAGNVNVPGWTNNFQLLTTQDPMNAGIQAISEGKNSIIPTTRSAFMGARGVRKLIQE